MLNRPARAFRLAETRHGDVHVKRLEICRRGLRPLRCHWRPPDADDIALNRQVDLPEPVLGIHASREGMKNISAAWWGGAAAPSNDMSLS